MWFVEITYMQGLSPIYIYIYIYCIKVREYIVIILFCISRILFFCFILLILLSRPVDEDTVC
jgi:hypothetical protein